MPQKGENMKAKLLFLAVSTIVTVSFSQNTEVIWDKMADFQGGKLESATSFSIGQEGYVSGGTSDGIHHTPACWQYNYKTNNWKKLADFPGDPLMSAVAFTIRGKAYLGTGLTGTGDAKYESADFWEYNPATDLWSKKAPFPGEARYGAIGFSIGDKGYIALGAKRSGFKTNYFTDLWEYSPEKNSWTKKADFPDKGKTEASVFVIDNSAYLLLGIESSMGVTPSLTNMWEYDSRKNKWTKKADFGGQPRLGANAFALNNLGYVFGGFNGLVTRYKDFWEYNPVSDKWNKKQDATCNGRNNAICFIIENSVYVGAGHNNRLFGNSKSDLWRITIREKDTKTRVDYNARLLFQNKNQNMPLSQQGVTLMGEEKVIQTATTNDKGEFSFGKLDVDGKYMLRLDKNDKLPANAVVAVAKPNGEITQKIEKNKNNQFEYELSKLNLIEEVDEPFINLEDFMRGPDKEIIITTKLYHPSGSSELLPEGISMIDKIIKALNKYPHLVLEISSHTDSNGDDASNMQLSEKRAQTVLNYIATNSRNIVADGVDPKRVSGKGFGETKILNRCKNGVTCSDEEHRENRRTEFKFIKRN